MEENATGIYQLSRGIVTKSFPLKAEWWYKQHAWLVESAELKFLNGENHRFTLINLKISCKQRIEGARNLAQSEILLLAL